MRALVIALLVATGCGGKRQVGAAGPPAVAAVFPAARWVPGQPTYVFAAPKLRDLEPAFRDVVAAFGLPLSRLDADALAGVGIDVDAGFAVFSDAINPTLVIHLSSPPALQQYLADQRARGAAAQSVVVDGTEVFSANVDRDLRVSWAIEQDWLLVHFTIGGVDDGTAWLAQSKRPSGASWVAAWQAAQQLATKPASLVGTVDARALAAKLAAIVPSAMQCAQRLEPVRGVGVVVEGEGTLVGGKLAVDLGGAAQGVAANVLAPPPGWATASARAPLSAQWNLDLRALATWVQPCISTQFGGPSLLEIIEQFGVRSGRAFVHSLDPDDKSGTGAVAIDLSHNRYFASLLDQIPLRSKFEKSRNFGAYKGKHLSVPFVATADYVLDDRVFLAAMGDGVLERAASGAPPVMPPVFAIDLVPAGLPLDVWEWLLTEADVPAPARIARGLQSWSDIHLSAHVDRDALVIEAQGNRR